MLSKEKELFDEWKKRRKTFSPDGLINREKYAQSGIKVMFILKEVNSASHFDLRDFLQRKAEKRRPTWDNIARWTYGISNLDREVPWQKLADREFLNGMRSDFLDSLIVMNVKKSSGGHTTDKAKMIEVAQEDGEFLKRQFAIYYNDVQLRPDIIVAGGSATSSAFNAIVDVPNKDKWKSTSRGVKYFEYEEGRFFIQFSHPEARVHDSLLYYGLVDAVREMRLGVR